MVGIVITVVAAMPPIRLYGFSCYGRLSLQRGAHLPVRPLGQRAREGREVYCNQWRLNTQRIMAAPKAVGVSSFMRYVYVSQMIGWLRQENRVNLVGLGFLRSVSHIKSIPTHEKTLAVGKK